MPAQNSLVAYSSLPTSEVQMFISVIVAVKNEARYIRKCVDSLLNQSYPADKYEILVVDGFSTDGSWEILD